MAAAKGHVRLAAVVIDGVEDEGDVDGGVEAEGVGRVEENAAL